MKPLWAVEERTATSSQLMKSKNMVCNVFSLFIKIWYELFFKLFIKNMEYFVF